MLLKVKIIFFTGGSAGIGLDYAKAYAAEGVHLVLCDRNGDLADAEAEKAIAFSLETFGRLDWIHNHADIASPSQPLREPVAEAAVGNTWSTMPEIFHHE